MYWYHMRMRRPASVYWYHMSKQLGRRVRPCSGVDSTIDLLAQALIAMAGAAAHHSLFSSFMLRCLSLTA
jgi:hypothetical protein